MKINAIINRKASEYITQPCVVAKTIELPRHEFLSLLHAPLKDRRFITENAELMNTDGNGVRHCLLALGEGCDEGLLINAQGYDYARYSAFVPNARQIVNAQQYKCLNDLGKSLSDAVDEVMSCAAAHQNDSAEPFIAKISDLMAEHKFDEAYIPLFTSMLDERTAWAFEIESDELIVYTNYQEQTQAEPQPARTPLPFAPERMERLLDKSLDWIGKLSSGSELYDTLKNTVGMTNEEIKAAGFDLLEEHFIEPDGDESEDIGQSMKMG